MLDSLSFLIPAYNDEVTIASVIRAAARVGRRVAKKFEILVINDASSDRTGQILDKLIIQFPQLRVKIHASNLGYGQTIKELYHWGRHDWLFTIPGDGQIPPDQIKKLLPAVISSDLILGWRQNRQDSPDRLRQSRVYNLLIRRMFGIPIHDVNSVRLVRRRLMEKLQLTSSSAFVDAQMLIASQRLKARITEIPIAHQSRARGTGGGGKISIIMPTVIDLFSAYLTVFLRRTSPVSGNS